MTLQDPGSTHGIAVGARQHHGFWWRSKQGGVAAMLWLAFEDQMTPPWLCQKLYSFAYLGALDLKTYFWVWMTVLLPQVMIFGQSAGAGSVAWPHNMSNVRDYRWLVWIGFFYSIIPYMDSPSVPIYSSTKAIWEPMAVFCFPKQNTWLNAGKKGGQSSVIYNALCALNKISW